MRLFHFLASLKTAIPLLVLTVIVTIIGSLQPDTDYYRTWWYLSLLGLNGLSLLFITILHIPSILVKKGRNALIGVVATHLGILILIGGIIYGGIAGERYQLKAIEGEISVVPGLPFVIQLDELLLEEYPAEAFEHMNLDMLPKKKQESVLTLYLAGEAWKTMRAGPGFPARADGYTILPSISDTGWCFELRVTDHVRRRDSFVPVRPWAPPLVSVGERQLMVHSVMGEDDFSAQAFTLGKDSMEPLGMITLNKPLELDGYTIALGKLRRYTGMTVYNRPHAPWLVAGCLAMLFGLVWHFYFRHRDRRQGGKERNQGA